MNILENNIEIDYFEKYFEKKRFQTTHEDHHDHFYSQVVLSKLYKIRNQFAKDYPEEYSFVTIKSKMYIQ